MKGEFLMSFVVVFVIRIVGWSYLVVLVSHSMLRNHFLSGKVVPARHAGLDPVQESAGRLRH
jgi:hypothetical protein